MKPELVKFTVVPSVVQADCESEIQITSQDGCFQFFDNVIYDVEFIPMEESDVPMDQAMSLRGFDLNRKSVQARPEHGILKLRYFFSGEQEWKIHISTKEYGPHLNPLYEPYRPYWDSLMKAPEQGVYLSVYSLKPDLFGRRALMGDLHIHTSKSDGKETPEMVAAEYRAAGYDFIAITDHNVFGTAKDAIDKFQFQTDLQVFMGEEVHNGYAGYFHMVNVGGTYSVNDIYLNDPQRVEKEAQALAEEVEVPKGLDRREYLNRVWLYREIKKSGGFAIYPHPYWQVSHHYHTETKMTRAILKNGLCDAYEVLGGCGPEDNNLQTALYSELRAEGTEVPVVGSTDSHSVLDARTHFKNASTIAFVQNGDVLGAVASGYSVAAEHLPGESTRVYGPFRLVKYAQFLLQNYFPVHNRLCQAAGTAILGLVCGENINALAEAQEARVAAFEQKFFGR